MLTKEIDVFSSVKVNGFYKRGYFKAIQVLDRDNPKYGKLLIVLDQEHLNFNIDEKKMISYILNNVDYFSKKGFVLSLSKFYLEHINSKEYNLFSLYN